MPEWRNWYTRATQNRVSQGLRVQVSPPAQNKPRKRFLVCARERNMFRARDLNNGAIFRLAKRKRELVPRPNMSDGESLSRGKDSHLRLHDMIYLWIKFRTS